MRLINKTNKIIFSEAAGIDIRPNCHSHDLNIYGFTTAAKKILRECGSSFVIKLNESELELINKLLEMHKTGKNTSSKFSAEDTRAINPVLKNHLIEVKKKMASIKKAQENEQSIRDESTYTSRNNIREAEDKANSIKGFIPAKKLDEETKELSLRDLMGDNKYIEENLNKSSIPTIKVQEEKPTKVDTPAKIDTPAPAKSTKKNKKRNS